MVAEVTVELPELDKVIIGVTLVLQLELPATGLVIAVTPISSAYGVLHLPEEFKPIR